MPQAIPHLWFDGQAEQAARFYVSIFPDSRIRSITPYNESVAEAAGQPAGSAMTVAFELDGQPFQALNGGPMFQLTEAISFVVPCASQEEIDHYWSRLTDGGEEQACGWLKDRYGVSWQVVPAEIDRWMATDDPDRARRVTDALFQMKKIDADTLREAYEGSSSSTAKEPS